VQNWSYLCKMSAFACSCISVSLSVQGGYKTGTIVFFIQCSVDRSVHKHTVSLWNCELGTLWTSFVNHLNGSSKQNASWKNFKKRNKHNNQTSTQRYIIIMMLHRTFPSCPKFTVCKFTFTYDFTRAIHTNCRWHSVSAYVVLKQKKTVS